MKIWVHLLIQSKPMGFDNVFQEDWQLSRNPFFKKNIEILYDFQKRQIKK